MSSSKVFRLFCAVAGFLFCRFAMAGVISLYDESRFLTFSDGQKIYGLYSAHNELFYCNFLFMSEKSVRDRDEIVPIETFSLDYKNHRYTYTQIGHISSIRGVLSKNGNTITISTEKPQGGCQSAAGLFSGDGGLPYTEMAKISGMGIGVINRKSFIYQNPNSINKRGYLLPGDMVVVINKKDNYSYIRYVNPDMLIEDDDKRHVSTGWVRSADLVNPFPAASKQ
ncbi:hypothetical protein PQR02_09555 [Paraburkholderia sediminicola]|uniref:Uncharacterized protein n=1 Tax=Paraburkholderia rhynchosiae TaxID=487049 RepID=A0ACC7NJH6_9BURK